MRQAYDYWQDQPGSNPRGRRASTLPRRGGQGASAAVAQGTEGFRQGLGQSRPHPRCVLGPRASHAPTSHTAEEGPVERRGCFGSSSAPYKAPEGGNSRGTGFRRAVFSTRTNREHIGTPSGPENMREIGCRQFDGRAQSLPTVTIKAPLIRRTFPRTGATASTTPREPLGKRASGRGRRRRPTPLSVFLSNQRVRIRQ